jgi:hypothetical protein
MNTELNNLSRTRPKMASYSTVKGIPQWSGASYGFATQCSRSEYNGFMHRLNSLFASALSGYDETVLSTARPLVSIRSPQRPPETCEQ